MEDARTIVTGADVDQARCRIFDLLEREIGILESNRNGNGEAVRNLTEAYVRLTYR